MKGLAPTHLLKLGLDQRGVAAIASEANGDLEAARVIAVHKERYTLSDGRSSFSAELVGKLIYSAADAEDFPTVGDWVLARRYNEGAFAIVHKVLPRKSLLRRKTAGRRVAAQLVAANIDTAFIIQSMDGNFNLRRLERYLAMVLDARIQPVMLLSKRDLLSPEQIAGCIAAVKDLMPTLEVLPLSNRCATDVAVVGNTLRPGKTYCLLGSSGVGKTTLLNHLMGEARFSTGAVREKDAKGRHTTTQRQLVHLAGGAMVVDTPGMRELGNVSADAGVAGTFTEIAALAAQCRFNDCTHVHEQDCAVLAAVQAGRLPAQRHENYLKMVRERQHYERSHAQRRQLDKQFGKYCKAVMKHKKDRR